MIICFCRPGVMAECTALGHAEQQRCRFYEKASFGDRCMHFNPELETCWTPAAADYTKGIINHEEPVDMEELQDYPIDDYEEPRYMCDDDGEESLITLVDLINNATKGPLP